MLTMQAVGGFQMLAKTWIWDKQVLGVAIYKSAVAFQMAWRVKIDSGIEWSEGCDGVVACSGGGFLYPVRRLC